MLTCMHQSDAHRRRCSDISKRRARCGLVVPGHLWDACRAGSAYALPMLSAIACLRMCTVPAPARRAGMRTLAMLAPAHARCMHSLLMLARPPTRA
mmetsp:Transcript_50748/g.131944  ORF Transcript_50748/g.131944 Transcript_50748/m.131944 type:complete len:96 (-) Transcript_50748:458-745(-)